MTNKKGSPSDKRETALSSMLQRLGASQTKEERYNNGFAHHLLAVHSSYARAHDKRLGNFIQEVNITVREAVAVTPEANQDELIGKTVLVERPIFEYNYTLTQWIENFYQESPSINARARDDQLGIGMEAFKQPAITGFNPFGEEDRRIPSKDIDSE